MKMLQRNVQDLTLKVTEEHKSDNYDEIAIVKYEINELKKNVKLLLSQSMKGTGAESKLDKKREEFRIWVMNTLCLPEY